MNNFQEIIPPRASEIAETLIFQTIWNRIPNRSFVSGLWLREFHRTPLWKSCFHRVLSVREYPCFKYFAGNIILLTPGERSLYTQCTEESLIHYALEIEEKTQGKGTADWNVIKDLEKDLIVQYKKYFPVTYKGIVAYKYHLREIEVIVGHLNKEFWDGFK
jgi:hypothetical protein